MAKKSQDSKKEVLTEPISTVEKVKEEIPQAKVKQSKVDPKNPLGTDLILYTYINCAKCAEMENMLNVKGIKFKTILNKEKVSQIQKEYHILSAPFLLSKEGNIYSHAAIQAYAKSIQGK